MATVVLEADRLKTGHKSLRLFVQVLEGGIFDAVFAAHLLDDQFAVAADDKFAPPSLAASRRPTIRAMYSAALFVAGPMYLPIVTSGVASSAARTTPIPASPGFPRLPPSKFSVIVASTVAF